MTYLKILNLHVYNAPSLIEIQLSEEKVNKTTEIIRTRLNGIEKFKGKRKM